MTTVSQSLRARGVVTTSYLLDPSPGVSGVLHKLAGRFSFTDEPEDLVVAALDGVVCLAVAVFEIFRVKVRLESCSLWHNAPLHIRT